MCFSLFIKGRRYMVQFIVKINFKHYHKFLKDIEAAIRGVLRKRCLEHVQQMYRRTQLPSCDFNKVAMQIY